MGSDKDEQVDIRVIDASNRDIQALVREGRFREDLFHRIAQATVHLPRLMDREREEFQALVEYILGKQRYAETTVSSEVIDFSYPRSWLGNIRELQSVLMLAQVECGDAHLPLIALRIS